MGRAVVLLSGGINSCVSAWAAKQQHELALLHIRYGHRAAKREEEAFRCIASELRVGKTLVVDLPHVAELGGSARVDRKLAIEDALGLSPTVASTFVPGLLPTIVGIAQQWAATLSAQRIVVGAVENLGPPAPPTGTIHPDCRRPCYQLLDHLLEITTSGKSPIRIDTPVIDLSRSEIVRLGHQVGAPLHLTWSCYRGEERPCGACCGCVTRGRGFGEAGLPDPLLARSARGADESTTHAGDPATA